MGNLPIIGTYVPSGAKNESCRRFNQLHLKSLPVVRTCGNGTSTASLFVDGRDLFEQPQGLRS
jgi:hypothetical protein